MKKFSISVAMILVICLAAFLLGEKKPENNEYLRIHIRANSNSTADQSVKYEIKDIVVSYITQIVLSSSEKAEVVEKIEKSKPAINALIDEFLREKGFDYKADTVIKNELFPTRTYEGLTLEKGYYDAVIINLGEGAGDNWWCVVYPPLCFTESGDVKMRSLVYEYLKKFFEKNGE